MNFKHLPLFFILVMMCLFSCTSYKQVPYFQDIKRDSVITQKISNYSPLTIQNGDLLGINVMSLNHQADAAINYNLTRPDKDEAAYVDKQEQGTIIGYSVHDDGTITLPWVGNVKVTGYTTQQIATILQDKLATYLTQPVITVRILNFKISVLGDVKTAGVFPLSSERVTITEALSLAGDLNTTGHRRNVILIREVDGQRITVPLDLTSKNVITSPYYYLKNNDVIYVTPNKERVAASDSTFQKASLIISALSILAIFVTRVN